jgi:polysaccharide chain length determinant protein (PEP-CTERM system associated)
MAVFDEGEDKKSHSFDELWSVAWRRRWWILLPMFGCWITVWTISWLLPTVYESEALILVEQQKVPEQYVVSNVTIGLQERLQSMTQQILSRTRLQSTIDRFHLYPHHFGISRFLQADDSVEQMRKDIKIELVATPGRTGELTAFKINYSAGSPELAQRVNSELTSLFIDESLKSQQQLSESTTSFLANQLSEARLRLEEQEERVRAFKAQHLGDLPSQLQGNVEILSGLQSEMQNVQRSLDAAKQQKLYLQSQLRQYQLGEATDAKDSDAMSLDSLEYELLGLRNRLAEARSRYKDEHPDIVVLKTKIAETEKIISVVEAANPANRDSSGSPPHISSSAHLQVWSQLKANELEIQNYQQQQKNLAAKISAYQARLNMTPETEQELADISRGYEESKTNYNSLLQKQNQSQLATNLEQRQQGEQFRVLDPPSLPDRPKSPNHPLLSIGGLILGCIAGLGILALVELTNVRVRREEDLDGVVPARILVRLPHLNTPREASLRTKSQQVETATALGIAVLMVVGNLYSIYKG